jgi:NADH:ubiquinone oxidoreductase subunit C
MDNDTLKIRIAEHLPSVVAEEGSEWPTFLIESEEWLLLAKFLRHEESLFFDYLFCLTCVDWKTHMTMVYHLSSTRHRHNIVIKSKLDKQKPQIESVAGIWLTADFHEREVYEMFGVQFLNHPDLRLLILPDGWEGKNPLLKDFDDPVNMIRL